MALKIEGEEMYPILVFAVLLVSSLQNSKAWQACAQKTANPTQPLQFHVKFMCMSY